MIALSGTVDSTLQLMCQKTLEHGQARDGDAKIAVCCVLMLACAVLLVGRVSHRRLAVPFLASAGIFLTRIPSAPRACVSASQVCMAADNLYHQCSKRSHIGRPTYTHTLEQLGVIQDYVNDLTFIAAEVAKNKGDKGGGH